MTKAIGTNITDDRALALIALGIVKAEIGDAHFNGDYDFSEKFIDFANREQKNLTDTERDLLIDIEYTRKYYRYALRFHADKQTKQNFDRIKRRNLAYRKAKQAVADHYATTPAFAADSNVPLQSNRFHAIEAAVNFVNKETASL